MTRKRGDAEPTDGYADTAAASLVRAKDGNVESARRMCRWLFKVSTAVALMMLQLLNSQPKLRRSRLRGTNLKESNLDRAPGSK
ncbi:hypothetical protein NC651_039367 [Populus alba x Populus x berolinensis]|nr:hypothetical protein NC651_039367 [Populus alba x Populus x berolinensis]